MMEGMTMHFTRHLRARNVKHWKGAHGFTLIELMVAIAILAILLGIAVPSFNDAALGSKLGSYANSFVSGTSLARSEAIKRNTTIVLCASANGTSCATSGGWEQGWIVACRTTDNIACDGAGPNWLVFQKQSALPSGFKATEGSALISMNFAPSGVGTTAANITICRATPTVGTQQRQIQVSATGRASISRISSTTCS
jgi:type IV fimbrial biogenesis protein FimT